MFQIFVLFIYTTSACKSMIKNLSIYPTLGERYSMPISKLFEQYNQNYSCINCSENITLWNTYNRLSQNDIEYTTQSLASNGTHFVTLTEENTINLYIYKNEIMSQTCLINIDQNLQCFNSLFSHSIIIDCYDNNNNTLQFYYLKICELSLYQTIYNQTIPNNTKMENIHSGLLYAQTYPDYQVLTLFQNINSQLINKTTWTQEFYDFDVSNRFIYIISQGLLQQLYVTENNTFSISFNYTNIDTFSFSGFKVQNPIFYYSNYDMIYTLYQIGTSLYETQFLRAYNGSIVLMNADLFFIQTNSSTAQILLSDQFVLYQVGNNLQIFEIDQFKTLYMYNHSNSETLQYSYLDSFQNLLFQFSNQIVISLIKVPQIEIYLSREEQLDSFIIESYSPYNKFINQTCYLKIQPFILQESDKNIYLESVSKQQLYFIFQNDTFMFKILGFTGPLQQPSIKMLNQDLGQFQDITLRAFNLSFPQQFQVTNFQNLDKNGSEIFFVGVSNGDLFFYSCLNLTQCTLVYSNVGLLTITKTISIFYYQFTLLVGINQGINDIRIYYFYVNSTIIEFSGINVYTFPPYKQFLFTYDNIIVLLENQNIVIQSLITSDQFTLGDKEITQLFPNYDPKSIHFKPIQMAMNEIDQSSILYINNQNSVIIVVVQSTYEIIPYSIIKVHYQIYQINIIVQKLILSYECEINICFEEWNVLNLKQPQFIKILPSIQMQRGWQIVSDNLFLYVKSQHNTMYVFNPALSYHDSLYYEFNFTENQFSSIAIQNNSLCFQGNKFYLLSVYLLQIFHSSINIDCQDQQYLCQSLFQINVFNNFSIASAPNKLLSLINPLTKIQLPKNQHLDSTIYSPTIFNLDPESNSNSSGLIIAYTTKQKKHCNLKNYIELQNSDNNFNQSRCQPLWIFLQNNQLIMQCFYNMTFCYLESQWCFDNQFQLQQNFTNCSMPLVYDDQLSQICYFNNSWYLFGPNSQLPIPIGLNITNITNLVSINKNTILFFQAVEQRSQQKLVYVTNMYVNYTKLQLSCSINDGLFSYSVIEFKYQPYYYLIIHICQEEIFYQIGYANQHELSLTMMSTQSTLFQLKDYFTLGNAKLAQILVISQQQDQMIFLLSTNIGPCFIFQATYLLSIEKEFHFHMFFGQMIQTISPYGNYQLIQITPILNGLMFFTYISNNDKVYAIYDLTYVHKNITNPLLMKGGYISSLPLPTNIAFNFTSIQEGGQFYELINNTINNYSVVGNAYLNCTFHSIKDYSIEILAYNSFSNDTYTITYHVIGNQWYISLFIFFSIIFTIASFVFWYNTRDLQNENNFLEEVELELDE